MHLFRRLRLLFLIVWVAVFSTSAVVARTPPDPVPKVVVSLFDDAHVPAGTLAEAQVRASAIFAHAGIELDWLVCAHADPADFSPSRTRCSDLAWPTHLSVRIIPHGRTVATDVFGQAFVDDSGNGVYSNIYYQNLTLSPNHPGIGAGEMLGYVLAHEIGHLLLGTNSHSHDGLMQATWTPHLLSDMPRALLVFTPAQSALIRSRLPGASKGLYASLQAKATGAGSNAPPRALCSLM